MENLLSFLTVRLRLKGITVNEFCKKIGISRQKFYRFVKDHYLSGGAMEQKETD